MFIALFRSSESLVLTVQAWSDALRLAERYGSPSARELRPDACAMVTLSRTDVDVWLERDRIMEQIDGTAVTGRNARTIARALETAHADLPPDDAILAAHRAGRRPSLLEKFSGEGRQMIHNLANFLRRGSCEILSGPPVTSACARRAP